MCFRCFFHQWVWWGICISVDVACIVLLVFIAVASVYRLLMSLRFVQWVYL